MNAQNAPRAPRRFFRSWLFWLFVVVNVAIFIWLVVSANSISEVCPVDGNTADACGGNSDLLAGVDGIVTLLVWVIANLILVIIAIMRRKSSRR